MTSLATLQNSVNEMSRPTQHLGPETQTMAVTLTLRSAEFRKGREQSWKQLADMVNRIEKHGIDTLSAAEVEQLPLLYRAVMSSLSVARNIVLDRHLLLYLENLSLRAYLAVYGPRTGVWHSLKGFFTKGFPEAVREIRWHLLVAFIAMAVGVLAGYLLVLRDPAYFDLILPGDLASGRGPYSSAAELKAVLFRDWPGFQDTFVAFANFLFQHNTIVGLMCFGLGFALGIPTIILLIYNGMIIGAFIQIHARHDLTVPFMGWLLIHGVTEILAILLCAASGLMVAQKILFPGQLTRKESLARYGRTAAAIAAGAVALFFCAAILEGFFRQMVNNTPGRYAIALLTGAFWLYYFAVVGKDKTNGSDI